MKRECVYFQSVNGCKPIIIVSHATASAVLLLLHDSNYSLFSKAVDHKLPRRDLITRFSHFHGNDFLQLGEIVTHKRGKSSSNYLSARNTDMHDGILLGS